MTLGQNVPKLDALHLMDGIEGLRSLPKHSVDMLLTDPPYGTTRNFWDVPLPLPELWEAVRWAVKPNGAILFFAQCPFDKVLGASNLAMLRYEWVWYKSRATGFLNANRAPLKKSENILVFYQKSPVYHPQFTYDDKDGQRQYEWGHYGSDRAALEQDFAARVQEYQRLYNVGVKQTEAPGLYKYYSTQRPVDIGTFPKPHRNAPDEIVNYDQRVPVENGSFLAWGHLTYTRPLTKRQASDYELRPAPDNPDRPRSIREQMKTAAKQAEADRGQSAPKKNAPDRGDR